MKLVAVFSIVLFVGQLKAQTKINVSFDKHTILILEDQFLVRKIENTCGDFLNEQIGSTDDNIDIDSLDNQHIRIQANSDFEPCNLSLFTNKGILSLDMVFNNDGSKPVVVFTLDDLIYKNKADAVVEQPKPQDGEKEKKLSEIQYVYDHTEKSYMNLLETSDLIDYAVTNIIYYGEYTYVFLVVDNRRSGADYELSGVVFSQSVRSKKNKASQEDVKYLSVLDKIIPEDKTIKTGEKETLCFQLERFTTTDNNVLYIDINEKDGRRKHQIVVKNNYITKHAKTL